MEVVAVELLCGSGGKKEWLWMEGKVV
jgi:hypothetical protein